MTKALPPGRAAEERVASLYRGLRFDAERDVRIGGKQWDVAATKREAGVGDLTVLIEVKDHPGASTPIQEVRDFANTASIALSQGHGTSAFFVTTGALTRDSGAVVAGLPNVNLIEFADLERQLFDPTGALQRWQLAYKSKPVNHRYVDLQATLFDISSNELGDFPGHVPATGLLGLATSSPSACVVIFGDYGSGKTTILQRLFSAAIEQTTIHRDAPFPVLLRLREFEQPYDIGDFVLRALRRDLGISDLVSSLLWEFVEAGRLIFMFDGFDEITLRADDAVRADLMARLSPLLFSPCPALLTTRPGYFASWEEYRGLIRRSAGSSAVARASDPGSQRVDDLIERLTARFVDASPTTARAARVIEYQLDPLTSDQVDEYLESARDELGETEPHEVRAFLDKVYDLSELITRPIILEMAVGTIAEGKVDVSKGTLANGAAGLYEAYARTHLNRDVANVPSRRDVLSPDDRLRFAEECASEMLRLDVLELAPETSRRLAQRILGESNEYNIDEALTDLRTCSFLTIGVDGTLEFIHRSYQEFFLARRLRDELRAGRRRLLYEPLRWEYLYFLGAFGYTDNDFYNELVEISRTEVEADATAANNAAVAVLAARETATSLRWHDRVLDGVRTRSTRIQDSDLINVSLAAKSIDELRIGGSKLDLRLTAGDYGALNLEDCTGSLATEVPIPELGVVGGDLRVTASESRRSFQRP